MKSFLWSLDERVWSSVVHGFPKHTKKIGKGDEETTVLKCANTLKKQKDGKNKALHTAWSDSDSDSKNNKKAIALITTVSLDELMKKDDDCEI
ncbi:unnamed protein product [Prunus armeniaca]